MNIKPITYDNGWQKQGYINHLRLTFGTSHLNCRIRIEVDGVRHQSFALGEVFSATTLSWNPIAELPWSIMETSHKSSASLDQFTQDSATLQRMLLEILR